MHHITIDPLTRIEGHMKIDAVVDGGEVKEAKTSGTMVRGFEIILRGRHPVDAVLLTQRICGVCPISHATASALALDAAFGLDDKIPPNGRIMRNIILASNYLQSHILHFYALCALDFVDVTAVAGLDTNDPDLKSVGNFISRGELAPFVPRLEGDYRLTKEQNIELVKHYIMALDARRATHELLAILGGKGPHNCGIVPGGVTSPASADKIAQLLGKINQIREFIDNIYLNDVLTVAKAYPDYLEIGKGCGRLLSYGAYDLETDETDLMKRKRFLVQGNIKEDGQLRPVDHTKIVEHVKYSRYADECHGHPSEGDTKLEPEKEGAYSWLKAPRYDDEVTEVGPLARIYASYLANHETVKPLVDSVLSELDISADKVFSVLGRHAARAIEAKVIADAAAEWAAQITPGEPVCAEWNIPDECEGVGMVGAPRGALLHWLKIADKKISGCQLVVPTTWNASPKDSKDRPGPMEQAIIGTKVKDPDNPFEIVRIARSFDPCLACSVHVINARGRKLGEFRIA